MLHLYVNELCYLTLRSDILDSEKMFWGNYSRFWLGDIVVAASVVFKMRGCRTLRKLYIEEVVRELQGSAEALKIVEAEWAQLEEDRRLLRKIFPKVIFHAQPLVAAGSF